MPNKSAMNLLDWEEVASHFRNRIKTSQGLLQLHDDKKTKAFAGLAIGDSNSTGNYSAAEHPVLMAGIAKNRNWEQRVYDLATSFRSLTNAGSVPSLIGAAQIGYLQISVGSELSCMVNPEICWVCNVRTIWTYIAWTRSPQDAEEQLKLYRSGSSDSEMAYINWAEPFHPLLGAALLEIAAEGRERASKGNLDVPPGYRFLWADAIASHAYGSYHGE
jgi:hypothetical protein